MKASLVAKANLSRPSYPIYRNGSPDEKTQHHDYRPPNLLVNFRWHAVPNKDFPSIFYLNSGPRIYPTVSFDALKSPESRVCIFLFETAISRRELFYNIVTHEINLLLNGGSRLLFIRDICTHDQEIQYFTRFSFCFNIISYPTRCRRRGSFIC